MPKGALSKIPAALRFSLAIWLASSFILTCWGYLIWKLSLSSPETGKVFYFGILPLADGWRGAFLGVWQRWDAIHYIRLVRDGYGNPDLSAFFPLYPWLASLFHRFAGVEITACLLLVSNLALFLALFFLFRLAEGLYDIAIAKATLVYLIIYPLAYFLHAPYTESLALCLSVLAYLGARQRRWAVAALAGLAAGLTRGTTLPLALAMGWEVWEDYKSNRPTIKMLPVLAWLTPALGTGLFLAWRSAAGFPSYSQILQRYWGRHFSWPWETLYSIFDLILSKYLLLSGWINLLILILALAITIWGVKKLPMGLRIYQVSLLGFMLMNTLQREPLGSFGRYSLLLFPQFILFALWCRTPFRRLAAFTLGVTLQLYLAGQFFMWGWTG